MATFKLKDGTELNVANYSLDLDHDVAVAVIEDYLLKNEVTVKHTPGLVFRSAVELTVNGKKTSLWSPNLDDVLEAMGFKTEQQITAYYNQMQADAQAVADQAAANAADIAAIHAAEALNKAAAAAKVAAEAAKLAEAAAAQAAAEQKAIASASNVFSRLEVTLQTVVDFTPEQEAAKTKMLEGVYEAFADLSDESKGTFDARLAAFKQTVTPLFNDAAESLDLTWGDVILNVLKEILNALTFAYTFGQAPKSWFFEPKTAPLVATVNTAKSDMEAALTPATAAI